MNEKKYYSFNTKRPRKSNFLFELDESALNIDFNSQRNWCAYTKDNNLYIVDLANNHLSITNESNPDIVVGAPVHRYEFGIYKGTFWSNSGDKIAFYKKDESMVMDYPLLDIANNGTNSNIIKYPMAGTESHHVSIGIFDIKKNKTIYLKTGEPKEQYLTNISWGPNDNFIYVVLLNRDQNHLKLNKYSVKDGRLIATLLEEKSDKYVQPLHPIEFISNNQFLWRSERNGADNLFLYNIDGEFIKNILDKKYLIKDYYGCKDGIIYFSSFTSDGLGVDLWHVNLNKKYQKKIVADGNYHHFALSPSKNFFIDKYSSTSIPLVTRIINNKGNIVTELLKSNNPLSDYKIGELELFKIKTEANIKLNARIIKPYNFDKKIKYPVLFYVYNGPGVQLINNRWLGGAPLWMYYLANQGYIVFTLDGRGSENRGRDFEQAIYGELGNIEMIDQMKGYNYLTKQSYVDHKRIAVHGWSYGGFMATNLLLNYPDFFTCGVAGGPVTNWNYYEIMYTERYMSHPNKNSHGYDSTNLINKVSQLKNPLLMIHGLIDDIVVPQHSLDFVTKAIDNNIKIDYFIYPDHPHNVRGKDRLHLIQKIIDYIRLHNK